MKPTTADDVKAAREEMQSARHALVNAMRGVPGDELPPRVAKALDEYLRAERDWIATIRNASEAITDGRI